MAKGIDSLALEDDFDLLDVEEHKDSYKPGAATSHEDNADTIVDPKLVSTKPGRVVTKGEFEVHTMLGHRLFYGRKKSKREEIVDGKSIIKNVSAIVGLVRFTTNVNKLFDYAIKDDPYADAKLIKIEEGLHEAIGLIDTRIQILTDLIDGMNDMRIKLNASIDPVTLPLEFRTPFFGFEATKMVKRFDRLTLLGLAAKQIGTILDADWNRLISKSGSKARHVFLLSSGYRYTGARRDDFAANNGVARSAIEKYGKLPDDILRGDRTCRFLPSVKR